MENSLTGVNRTEEFRRRPDRRPAALTQINIVA
jgi:hypothetical protein